MAIATPQVNTLDGQHGIDIGFGAPGRNRTGMALRPTDFKSVASTNSATGARDVSARLVAILREKPPAHVERRALYSLLSAVPAH